MIKMKKCTCKTCTTSGPKPLTEFQSDCKFCRKKKMKQYHIENKEERNLAARKYKEQNKEKCDELNKRWRKNK